MSQYGSKPDISVRLLRKAENVELPLAALEAISVLRAHLAELEMEHVNSARAKGAAWEDIAESMGISRQALQQKVRYRTRNERNGV